MTTAALPTLFGKTAVRIHCVGVAGMGLGPLAVYLSRSGWQVSGEDDSLDAAAAETGPGAPAAAELRERLLESGVRLEPLPEACDLVVTSSAVLQSHPTVLAARQRGLSIVRRGELLAEVVKDKRLVAVCGSHGKTTTTAMLASALRASGALSTGLAGEPPPLSFGFILGGLPARREFPLAQVAGAEGAWVVAEVDESDGTIEHFTPEITLCVNLDWDHVDHYPSEDALRATFGALFAKTRRAVLINAACPLSQTLAAETAAVPVFRFGDRRDGAVGEGGANPVGEGGGFTGEITAEGGDSLRLALGGRFEIASAELRASGRFNALNATAALAAVQLMGAQLHTHLLAKFPGVRRRQTRLSDLGGLRVIEDYAHHPAEIRALLAELRRDAGKRLYVCFQPHRYSRTAQFKRELAEALSSADHVFLIDVYGAGESPVEGGTTADLAREFAEGGATYCRSDEALLAALGRTVAQASCVAFVGAGNIDAKARAWLALWRARFWDEFAQELRGVVSAETKLTREEPLARKTTMLVGGAARVYAEPRSVEELQRVLRSAHARGVPVFPIGRGSNLIVPDEGVEGLVISLSAPEWAKFEVREDGRIYVSAGLRLKNLCGLAAKAGIAGFEFLEGIPGSVGGALRMNAGAMGAWIFDAVELLEFITLAGEVVTRRVDELHVGYRHCAELAEGAIALGALLRSGAQVDTEAVARQIDVYRKKRVESQPREPSAGCIFKNPEGDSAGRLIDSAGLKGLRVGGAEVSAVHANFIVNRDHATASEVLELVAQVQARVLAAHGVALEPEARLFGKDWSEVAELSDLASASSSTRQKGETK
ncbi:hypothetical protein AXK12_07290 [Cephaloticoccus capnophilus]|uniref:UDP-N-acetylenolpyruvoylglucosamine reductase n=2 Tax=Cephaloticoccus capnophilus TaxID=1548208 RepID=A0A139SJ01_9BACT|nr:hypothetical protein AXK12_07290 [Cephaloticoccus capnophilus]